MVKIIGSEPHLQYSPQPRQGDPLQDPHLINNFGTLKFCTFY
jgi:hypothetical protein